MVFIVINLSQLNTQVWMKALNGIIDFEYKFLTMQILIMFQNPVAIKIETVFVLHFAQMSSCVDHKTKHLPIYLHLHL